MKGRSEKHLVGEAGASSGSFQLRARISRLSWPSPLRGGSGLGSDQQGGRGAGQMALAGAFAAERRGGRSSIGRSSDPAESPTRYRTHVDFSGCGRDRRDRFAKHGPRCGQGAAPLRGRRAYLEDRRPPQRLTTAPRTCRSRGA